MPEQTTGPTWTPEDVDRLAEAEGKRRNGPASDGRGWYRTEAERMECYAVAETALAALAEAGRLTPPAGSEDRVRVQVAEEIAQELEGAGFESRMDAAFAARIARQHATDDHRSQP